VRLKVVLYIALLPLVQSCSSIPKQYTEVCEGGGCVHMANRCKQIKAAGSLQTQYGVTPIKGYEGPALVDGMWSVRCRDGKIIEILDSKFKDIESYQ